MFVEHPNSGGMERRLGSFVVTCGDIAFQVLNDEIFAPLRAAHQVPDAFLENGHSSKAHHTILKSLSQTRHVHSW